MADKLISSLEEGIPAPTDFVLYDPGGSGYYKKSQAGNLPGGAGGATPLSTPTLTATVISSTQIDLSWTNVANESSYRLEWSPNGTSGWTQIGGTIAANTTTYSHTGLTAATAYYYRVKAVGDGVTYSDSGYGTDNDTTSAGGGYDADAQALFTAAGTDTGKQSAINQFFLDVKGVTGLYAKIRAGYLLINGSLAKDKYNIKSPLDTDGAFRLTDPATATHTATGVTGRLRTHFNMSTSGWTTSQLGLSLYNETDTPNYGIQMGAGNAGTGGIGICTDDGSANLLAGVAVWNNVRTTGVTDNRGFYTITFDSSDSKSYCYKNGVLVDSQTESPSLIDAMVLINSQGSDAAGSNYLNSSLKTSFAFIHDNLTGAQALGLYNAVAALRTALGGF